MMNSLTTQMPGEPKDIPVRSYVLVSTPAIRRRQWWMTCLIAGVPTLGTVAAIIWAFYRPIGYTEVCLGLGMWIVSGGLGVVVGYHRFLVHRSFEAPSPVRFLLTAAGAMAFQGPPIYWVAVHRRHHEHSDGPGDPHAPITGQQGLIWRLRALWHAHVGWMANHDMPNTLHYAPDLLKDRAVMWVNRHYLLISFLGLLIPTIAAGALHFSWEGALAGFLWGGPVRLFCTSNSIWSVNSICHLFGSRDYETDDDSRNVALLAILTFGESWHNNHHAFPTSAQFGMRWWQFDLGYLIIILLACFGLVRNVRTAK
jgi:stearoyl-CoA desaturase (delta-9 desaturase)